MSCREEGSSSLRHFPSPRAPSPPRLEPAAAAQAANRAAPAAELAGGGAVLTLRDVGLELALVGARAWVLRREAAWPARRGPLRSALPSTSWPFLTDEHLPASSLVRPSEGTSPPQLCAGATHHSFPNFSPATRPLLWLVLRLLLPQLGSHLFNPELSEMTNSTLFSLEATSHTVFWALYVDGVSEELNLELYFILIKIKTEIVPCGWRLVSKSMF